MSSLQEEWAALLKKETSKTRLHRTVSLKQRVENIDSRIRYEKRLLEEALVRGDATEVKEKIENLILLRKEALLHELDHVQEELGTVPQEERRRAGEKLLAEAARLFGASAYLLKQNRLAE